MDEILASIDAVTREEIQSLAQDFFQTELIAATVLGPVNGLKITRERLAC
jgi:predicted Zn-dependent peptidase